MNREVEIAWAAGLFEGEGCFTQNRGRPVARLTTTDVDIVVRFAEAIGWGMIYGPYEYQKRTRRLCTEALLRLGSLGPGGARDPRALRTNARTEAPRSWQRALRRLPRRGASAAPQAKRERSLAEIRRSAPARPREAAGSARSGRAPTRARSGRPSARRARARSRGRARFPTPS